MKTVLVLLGVIFAMTANAEPTETVEPETAFVSLSIMGFSIIVVNEVESEPAEGC